MKDYSVHRTTELLRGDVEGPIDQKWEWSHFPEMVKWRSNPGIAFFDHRVFVAGGNNKIPFDIECINLLPEVTKLSQWTIISIMDISAVSPFNLITYNSKMYLISEYFLQFSP